jgi:hypothetical protein
MSSLATIQTASVILFYILRITCFDLTCSCLSLLLQTNWLDLRCLKIRIEGGRRPADHRHTCWFQYILLQSFHAASFLRHPRTYPIHRKFIVLTIVAILETCINHEVPRCVMS